MASSQTSTRYSPPRTPSAASTPQPDGAADRLALGAIAAALAQAREEGERRPAFHVIVGSLGALGVAPAVNSRPAVVLERDRDAWLLRLRSAERSASAIKGYRHAIDELLRWARETRRTGELFTEQAVVEHLEDYRRRCGPAPATYHRRFLLLRRWVGWVAQRNGLPDPFSELPAPPKPRQERDWLTAEEFGQLLDAAARPTRARPGLARRDRLVLLTLALTGVRRSELIALNWGDVIIDGGRPSMLVRRGKGGRPRRQPLAPMLAAELRDWRAERGAGDEDPVFCGLAGGRLHARILTGIISRARASAGLSKHVTAHTLRHTAATWLRQATGDTRLVAEYLGHADLSTVSRYAHVASEELHAAAQTLVEQAGGARATRQHRARVHPGQLSAWG